jgi:exopolysaccharide biosynthesis polyprenyl glycosylphosphotransferase
MASLTLPTRWHRRAALSAVLLLSDILMLVLGTTIASIARFGRIRHIEAVHGFVVRIQFADLSLVVVLIWVACLAYERLYDLDRVFWGTGEYRRVARGLSLGVVVFIMVTYVLKLQSISRGWVLLAWALSTVLVILGRSIFRAVLAAARRRGHLLRRTLIVGDNAEAIELIARLNSNPSSGLDPQACLAALREDVAKPSRCGPEIECLGSARDIAQVLTEHSFDTVVIASTAFGPDVLSRIITDLRGFDVDIELSSGLLDVTTSRVLIREVSGVPLITVRGVSFSRSERFTKRAFDLVVGALIIVIGMPFWLLLALLIKLESKGPIFYRQVRVGRDGAEFGMWKFRSMQDGADLQVAGLTAENEASGPLFKMKQDPRTTRVGRWMRKFSIDEFPQVLNVLGGEMSLVGPRPALPDEVAQYSAYDWRRMEVLPGMTGLWQVSGRSTLTFPEMVRLDLFYIENWTVGFDIGIMLRTIPAVLFARGAY